MAAFATIATHRLRANQRLIRRRVQGVRASGNPTPTPPVVLTQKLHPNSKSFHSTITLPLCSVLFVLCMVVILFTTVSPSSQNSTQFHVVLIRFAFCNYIPCASNPIFVIITAGEPPAGHDLLIKFIQTSPFNVYISNFSINISKYTTACLFHLKLGLLRLKIISLSSTCLIFTHLLLVYDTIFLHFYSRNIIYYSMASLIFTGLPIYVLYPPPLTFLSVNISKYSTTC